MFSLRVRGRLKKTYDFLNKCKHLELETILEKYAKLGVEALKEGTPEESGKTADSWGYEIEFGDGFASIHWTNSNTNKNVVIALLLQYGHGTGTGGWVEGRDYINPALKPIFDQIMIELWKEVTG